MKRTRMIGVDVGGTFTDVFFLDEASGEARVAKVPTTRPDQSGGFLAGIRAHGEGLEGVASVVHRYHGGDECFCLSARARASA